MHEISIPYIRFAFHPDFFLLIPIPISIPTITTNILLLPTLKFPRNKPLPLSKMLTKILNDKTRLGKDNRFLSLGLEFEDWRFA